VVKLLDEHIARREHVDFAAVFIANIVGIFCFWKHVPSDANV
jgi:hypothetical protein